MKSRRSVFGALTFCILATFLYRGTDCAHAATPISFDEQDRIICTNDIKGPLVSSPALSADGLTLYVGSGDHPLGTTPGRLAPCQ